jgi:hypothetical protein
MASLGIMGSGKIEHEPHQSLEWGGLLFLLPALLSQGLLKSKDIYQYTKRYYYSLETIVLTLALMSLARIKNPEQLKNCKSGEIGRLLGIDRIPETKCLREKIHILASEDKSWEWNKVLMNTWIDQDTEADSENEMILYIDGHVRIYHGYKANLPVKFISRQKLCLSATTEFWVNDKEGLPLMVVLGELSEKLQGAIIDDIIPRLIQSSQIKEIDKDNPPQSPQCTLVFDREAYDFKFFEKLWDEYRIAFITYRKNVKNEWDKELFQPLEIQLNSNKSTMLIHENKVGLGERSYREVRKLCSNGHQTSIITSHPTLSTANIASNMFSRWSQENFFRYMISDYDFDKIIQYGVETINPETKIVNPEYKKLNYQLKKIREKISRKRAKFFEIAKQVIEKTIDELPKLTQQKSKYMEEIEEMEVEEKNYILRRSQTPYHIKLSQMEETKIMNKLKTESKLLMNVIKMICYRAETAVANILEEKLKRGDQEKRMLVKQIIKTPVDLIPDKKNNVLNITLYSLSSNRYNQAVFNLIDILNETETIFPGTNMKMVFKSTASIVTRGREF